MVDRKNGKPRAEDMAWAMFEKTGDVGYYLLYKKLSKE